MRLQLKNCEENHLATGMVQLGEQENHGLRLSQEQKSALSDRKAAWTKIRYNLRMDNTNDLIKHLLSHPDTCESDSAANDLLTAYLQESPVDSLRVLLASEDDRIAVEAA